MMKNLIEDHRASGMSLSVILSHVNNLVICLNLKGKITEFNAAAEKFYYCERSKILNTSFRNFCKDQNFEYPSILNNHEPIIKTGIQEFSTSSTQVSGLHCSISWKVLPSFNSENKIIGFILIGRYFPEERNVNDFLHAYIELIPSNYWWKDIHGYYLGCNNSAIKMFGLNSPADIIGKNDYEMPWVETADILINNDKNVVENDVTQILEEQLTAKDGSVIPLLVVKAPLRDEEGKIIGTIGNAIDLTVQKKGTKSIENRLESIIDSIAGNHWWKDANGVYLGCNDSFITTLGLHSHADVIGKTDYELPWAETAEVLVKNDQEVMRLGVACRNEEQLATKAGEVLTFMVAKAPLRDENGNIIGTVGNSIDITEQKRIEKSLLKAKQHAEQANQAKSHFLATVSHELRTPLNGILGMADILSREKLALHQKEFIKDIQTSGKNLLALMNDILDFSKLETGKLVLKIKPFNLKKLGQDIVSTLSYQIEDKDIQLLYEYAATAPEEVLGDQLRVTQILVNLIGNAIKFTEQGFIKVKITGNTQKNNFAEFIFIVEDTGIGIPDNKLDQIFDRFTQVETEHYNRRFGGVGLGLAICRQLVETMGGHIGVKSKLNEGSEFHLAIPFQLPIVDKNKANQDTSEQVTEEKLLFNFYVLMVEDELINQKILSTMLGELGCRFDIAENGEQALNLININSYDLVFMDIGLPDIDGILLTKKIRKEALNKKYLPIIATTAYALEEEIQSFHAAGVNDVITKPIEQVALQNVLKKWIRNSSHLSE
jgi:PAS domain S-box-containing protein